MVIHNLPQRYGKEPYPNTSSDWEKVAIELMKRGVFLFGGGLALYFFIKLLEEQFDEFLHAISMEGLYFQSIYGYCIQSVTATLSISISKLNFYVGTRIQYIYKRNRDSTMIRYIVLTTVVAFLSIVILILHFYLKNNKYEAEIESERIEEIWELQRKNLEIDLREANDMGAFKSYEY